MSYPIPVEIDSAIDDLLKAFAENAESFGMDLGALKLKVRLQGEKWSGLVDKPVAKFLLDLDRKLRDELEKVGIEIPETDHGLVALQVNEGSMEAVLKYSKEFKEMLLKMKPSVQIVLITAILAGFGMFYTPEIISKLNETKMEEARARERLELVRTVGEISKSQRELQTPVRNLVKTMGANDKISLPSVQGAVGKKDVQKHLVKAVARSAAKTLYVDHRYIVQELSTKKPGEWQIGIFYGGLAFKAKLNITADQIEALLKNFQEAHARNSEIAPDLQVTADFSSAGIRNAQVVGIGAPRPQSVSLSKALEEARKKTDAAAQAASE